MDNKYKNGKIYTIRNKNDDSLIYVGSTVVPLYKRLSQHKTMSKNIKYENILLYIKMNEKDINSWYIELFEDCACERKEQLNKREGEVIREIGTLNKRIEGRTKEEYYLDNIDKIKEYREANIDKIKEYEKVNKEKILERKKIYRESNKDIIKEKRKNYYLKNKK